VAQQPFFVVQRLNMWLNTRYRFVAGLVAGLGSQKTLFATVQEICQHPCHVAQEVAHDVLAHHRQTVSHQI
jgi:hypothetical protein